ncbi:hypothetical protein ACR3K2_11960 [Cryptosporidium serpentis]
MNKLVKDTDSNKSLRLTDLQGDIGDNSRAFINPQSISLATSDNTGVIYISRIPPGMQPHHIREYMSQFGEIDRIFMYPEDKSIYEKRVKMSGSRQMRYIDGWIEFKDKQIAKSVAISLNNTNIGGKKRHNRWRDDIWCLRYLPKFKWHNLIEHHRYKKAVRKVKLQARLSQVQKENNFYIEQVDKAKRKEKLQKINKSEGNRIDSSDIKYIYTGEIKNISESNEKISKVSLSNLL